MNLVFRLHRWKKSVYRTGTEIIPNYFYSIKLRLFFHYFSVLNFTLFRQLPFIIKAMYFSLELE